MRCKDGLKMIVVFTCAVIGWSPVFADQYVARITETKGAVTLRRGSENLAVEAGTRLQNEDAIKTGSDGSIGIIFNDETALSLGSDSDMVIQTYIFEPEKAEFSFVIKLLKGTASYVSGLIAKLSPEAAKFITPSASIGIRGTKFVIEVE